MLLDTVLSLILRPLFLWCFLKEICPLNWHSHCHWTFMKLDLGLQHPFSSGMLVCICPMSFTLHLSNPFLSVRAKGKKQFSVNFTSVKKKKKIVLRICFYSVIEINLDYIHWKSSQVWTCANAIRTACKIHSNLIGVSHRAQSGPAWEPWCTHGRQQSHHIWWGVSQSSWGGDGFLLLQGIWAKEDRGHSIQGASSLSGIREWDRDFKILCQCLLLHAPLVHALHVKPMLFLSLYSGKGV